MRHDSRPCCNRWVCFHLYQLPHNIYRKIRKRRPCECKREENKGLLLQQFALLFKCMINHIVGLVQPVSITGLCEASDELTQNRLSGDSIHVNMLLISPPCIIKPLLINCILYLQC
ncbi:Os10g0422583 [Oryza sativa Japonica Group]|uniref:Os10g0422583 protein n=1 Tax=Oryza sativa subsp. japonica TaxID=39947 RepID=A0A0P0XUW7_ORYSJ|nr:hypothetical protein EE612_051529 [Oryza sativa]BAT10909.1 Os10g0422583 [Oryza sativa Japonica Group]